MLIFDEAQTLTPRLLELFRQLVNYETNERKLLQQAEEPLDDVQARPSRFGR